MNITPGPESQDAALWLSLEYFERGKAELKEMIESSPKSWSDWTKTDRRYSLHSKIKLVDGGTELKSGRVTDYLDTCTSANSVEALKAVWKSPQHQGLFDTTTMHFIVDNQEKKVVEFLSVCM